MQQLLKDLEAERAKAAKAEATASELQAALAAGQQAADTLAFNEANHEEATR